MATDLASRVTDASSVQFLPEILYHIIELCGDLATLRSCTLVAKAWRYVAQSQLLCSVYIFTALRHRSPNAFIIFLESHPDVCPSIRDVTIKKRPRGVPPGNSSASLYELRAAIVLLPQLDSLSIVDIAVYPGPFETSPLGNLAGPPPKKIDVLELQGACINYSSDHDASHLNILRLFSNINNLRVSGLRFKSLGIDHPAEPTLLPIVHAIEIIAPHPSFLLDFLPCLTSPNLATLRLNANALYTDVFFREYHACTEATTNLKEFQLYVPCYNLPNDCPQVSLTTCLSLEKITLVLTFSSEDSSYGPVPYQAMWSNVLSVLSSIPSASPLRRLKLVLVASNPARDDGLDFKILSDSWDTFLNNIERFNKLLLLEVVITLSAFPDEPTVNRVYHPSVIAFFNARAEEGPPQSQRYALKVSFIPNEW